MAEDFHVRREYLTDLTKVFLETLDDEDERVASILVWDAGPKRGGSIDSLGKIDTDGLKVIANSTSTERGRDITRNMQTSWIFFHRIFRTVSISIPW